MIKPPIQKKRDGQKVVDFELALKVREGDDDAFEIIFKKHIVPLCKFSCRYVKNIHVAESIVHDVFHKILLNRKKWNPSSTIPSYLYTAVRNESLNYLKHIKVENRREQFVDLPEKAIMTPEDEFTNNETIDAVRKALDELPDRCREIFIMKIYDGFSYAEIAAILNISTNTINVQVSRAYKTLRKNLSIIL